MGRTASLLKLSIAELNRVIQSKVSEVKELHRRRAGLQKRLDKLDRQIERLGGGQSRGLRGAVGTRNEHNLPDTIESVLGKAGKPITVSDITDAVLAAGYRSGSANFRGIVNQTLVKDARFSQVGRGVYRLQAGGKSQKARRSTAE